MNDRSPQRPLSFPHLLRQAALLVCLLVLLTVPGVAQHASGGASTVEILYPTGPTQYPKTLVPLTFNFINAKPSPATFKTTWSLNSPMPSVLSQVTVPPLQLKQVQTLMLGQPADTAHLSFIANGTPYSPHISFDQQRLIVGVLANDPQSFDYLRPLQLEPDPNAAPSSFSDGGPPKRKLIPLSRITHLDPKLLPTASPLLASLNLIIVFDLPQLQLSTAQMQALLDWSDRGGQLVLVSNGNPNEYRDTPFWPALPLTPTQASLSESLSQVSGPVKPDSITLVSNLDQPLLLQSHRLLGHLYFLTTPLSHASTLNESKALEIWKPIVAQAINDRDHLHPASTGLLQQSPDVPYPNRALIICYLVGYAIFAGPLHILYLRRRGKMQWSVISVPLITVFFTAIAFLFNYLNRPHSPAFRELGVLQTQSGLTTATIDTDGIFYSPSRTSYPITSGHRAAIFPTETTFRPQSQTSPSYELTADNDIKTMIQLGSWDLKTLSTQGLLELPSPITGHLDGSRLILTSPLTTQGNQAMVYNSALGISNAFTIVKGQQTIPLTFQSLKENPKLKSLQQPNPSNDPHQTNRQLLLDRLTSDPQFPPNPNKNYLIFWTNELLTPLSLPQQVKHQTDLLIVVELAS